MKLFYLGNELDSKLEYELNSKNEFGFIILVVYIEESWMSLNNGSQAVDLFTNVTEVHNLYETFGNKEKIAFESNIHQTGCNRDVKDIQIVVILNADKLHKEF